MVMSFFVMCGASSARALGAVFRGWRFPGSCTAPGDDAGSAAVEFAFAAPILFLIAVAAIEFGMVMLVTTLAESALRDAARFGVTGLEVAGQTRLERVVDMISERTFGLVNMEDADIQVLVYPGFEDVGLGESFVDGNGNGVFDAGETFTDDNGNGVWDADVGVAGAGGSGEVVVYRFRYAWPLLTPLGAGVIGTDGHLTIEAGLAVRNEPWGEGGAP
jgi:hypothetical protein